MAHEDEKIIEQEIILVEQNPVRTLTPLQFFGADAAMADSDFRARVTTGDPIVALTVDTVKPTHPTQAQTLPMPPEGMEASALPPLPTTPTGDNPPARAPVTKEDVENAKAMIPPVPTKYPSEGKTPPIA